MQTSTLSFVVFFVWIFPYSNNNNNSNVFVTDAFTASSSSAAAEVNIGSKNIPPPISLPVWALAVPTGPLKRQLEKENKDISAFNDIETSMNVMTFVSSASVSEPRLCMISLYYDTLTKDAFMVAKQGVLQLLKPKHNILVPYLGKRSGYEPNFNKQHVCADNGFTWVQNIKSKNDDNDNEEIIIHNSPCELIPDCVMYFHIELRDTMEAGDHIVCLCEVVDKWCDTDAPSIAGHDHTSVLYTGQLRIDGLL